MKHRSYYNDNDPLACAWLRELIAAGDLPDGVVDDRSITEIEPHELQGFTQCHFFAGVSGWALALRWAGWPDDRPVWSASCPCQPFSCAGQRKAHADERHLWPELFRLIKAVRPPVVFGEQVASADVLGSRLEADFLDAVSRGDCAKANKLARRLVATRTVHYWRRWFDGVCDDLGGVDYTIRANDLPAACVGAPHRRQRLYWMAHARHSNSWVRVSFAADCGIDPDTGELADECSICGAVYAECECPGPTQDGYEYREQGGILYARRLAHRLSARLEGHAGHERDGNEPRRIGADAAGPVAACGGAGGLADVERPEWRPVQSEHDRDGNEGRSKATSRFAAHRADGWSDFSIIPCRDGKARRVESGTFPLVARLPRGVVSSGNPSVAEAQATAEARQMRLKGYGNAICVPLAAEFVRACMEAMERKGEP